jgi:hypothetical protein
MALENHPNILDSGKMKTLAFATAAVALLAFAVPASAQMASAEMDGGPHRGAGWSRWHDQDARFNAGPQYRFMISHGYTVDDAKARRGDDGARPYEGAYMGRGGNMGTPYRGERMGGYQGAAMRGDQGAAMGGNQGAAMGGNQGAAMGGNQGAAMGGNQGGNMGAMNPQPMPPH